MKICISCGLEKDKAEFYIKDKATGRLDSKCKSCVSEDRRVYYEDNKEQIVETHKEYYEVNKPKVFASVIQWQRDNPDKCRQYDRTTTANLRKTDPDRLTARNKRKEKKLLENPVNRLAKNLRNRVRNVLKGRVKTGSAVKDLGCSLDELKQHLESQWQESMSWGNYGQGLGKWSIDHIIPLTAFDLTNRQHVVLACHYLNLQPLWHTENASKGNKLDFEFRRVDRTVPESQLDSEPCLV